MDNQKITYKIRTDFLANLYLLFFDRPLLGCTSHQPSPPPRRCPLAARAPYANGKKQVEKNKLNHKIYI